jgi:S-adenosylmethionine hydrolase
MKHSLITLTTDFGSKDIYVAAMKGVIISTNPEARIIDVTHDIEPHNIAQAAFVLNMVYHYFPKEAVHMAIVDPGVGGERLGIILRAESSFFVVPNNGILSYVISDLSHKEEPASNPYQHFDQVNLRGGIEAVAITDPRFWRHPVSSTFHGRDIFAPVAAGLSLGISMYEFGEKITSICVFPVSRPCADESGEVIGQVVYIDHFGNLITDIRSAVAYRSDVVIEVAGLRIEGIDRYYEEGEGLMAIMGSSGYLEIALKDGSASDFTEAIVGDEVRVTATA